MSYRIGLDAINLQPAPRLAHTEYSAAFPAMVKAVVGQYSDTATGRFPDIKEDVKRFYDAWDYDLIWNVHDGPVPWSERGRVTDMGHAEYAEGGTDKRESKPCPFECAEEVLEFDAIKEYGLPDFRELVDFYEQNYQQYQMFFENQVFPGSYYKSVVSGAIEVFGWDMLLLAAADLERFAGVLRSFGELTLHHVKAWAETSIEVFIQHDDMVWTEGPFMRPDFYRSVIFPMYKEFWEVLHKAGKRVLFCSDGKYDMFMDDIAAAGADGFIFEPCNNFDEIVRKFGKTRCLVGSKVDCRTMTFRDWDAVKEEIDATLKLVPECAGLIWAVGNHIPSNVPVEVGLKYIDYLKLKLKKANTHS